MKGVLAIIITATELKTNIGKYLRLAQTQDIIVTKNNKPIVKLTSIKENKLDILDSLVGIIEDDGYTLEDALAGVIAKRIKADYIITCNTKDFNNSPVSAIDPKDFLHQFAGNE